MDQHSLTLQLRFQRLLAKLFPQELYYIGGPDPLPPPLSPEEEREMTRRLKNHDEAARATLIEHNLRLVVFISRRELRVRRYQDAPGFAERNAAICN